MKDDWLTGRKRPRKLALKQRNDDSDNEEPAWMGQGLQTGFSEFVKGTWLANGILGVCEGDMACKWDSRSLWMGQCLQMGFSEFVKGTWLANGILGVCEWGRACKWDSRSLWRGNGIANGILGVCQHGLLRYYGPERSREQLQFMIVQLHASSMVECRTRDSKVAGYLSPRQGHLSVLTLSLISVTVPPHTTAVARKRSRPFCKRCRWKVKTVKYTCHVRMWLRMKWDCKLVRGCTVYTKRAPRRHQFHVAPPI